MRKLLASTAVLVALALPAVSQTASPYLEGVQDSVRASSFIGKRVYITEADTATMSTEAMASADANWQDAGEISDLILSRTGDTEAVLVDFGGFLGIGEKTVAVDLRQLVMVPDSGSPDNYFIVFKGTKADLEGAPVFNPDMVFTATQPATEMTTETKAADATATTEAAKVDAVPGEAVDLTSWAEADLVGKRVYGPNDEDVGEISAVALTADGKISGAVVDVGGFLGMGEKKVSLTSEMLQLVKPADGSAPYFRVSATQAELEAMAPYQG